MLGARRHKRRAVSYGAIIDVSSGSVGVGIVVSRMEDKLPIVIYTHRESIKISKETGSSERVRAMRQSLFAAISHLNGTGLKALRSFKKRATIDRVLLVCGAPWSYTTTHLVHLKEEKPFKVTEELIQKLLADAKDEEATALPKTGILSDLQAEVTEQAVIGVTLNGYPTTDPYNKEVNELSLAHLYGLIPRDILNAVREVEEKVLAHTTQTFHTYALILFCVLRDLYPHTQDALIVDVSGEATEVCVVKDHILHETQTVPYGTYTFMRDISKTLGTIPEEARTHLVEYSKDAHLDKKVAAAIDDATNTYRKYMETMYKSLAERHVLPRNLLLTAGLGVEDFFAKTLQEIRPYKTSKTEVIVTPIKNSTSSGLVTYEEKVQKDIFIAISARFLHKLHGCGELF